MDCGSESTGFFCEEITVILDHLQKLLPGKKIFGQLTHQFRLNTEVKHFKFRAQHVGPHNAYVVKTIHAENVFLA